MKRHTPFPYPNTVTHSSPSTSVTVADEAVLGGAGNGIPGDRTSAFAARVGGGDGGGSARTSLWAGSTIQSLGEHEPGGMARERSHEGRRLAEEARVGGDGDGATGRRLEADRSGEKSCAYRRSSRVKRGGGVDEGSRDPEVRWEGMARARSRKKGDCLPPVVGVRRGGDGEGEAMVGFFF